MLHYETIDPATLGVLKQLLQIEVFSDLRLAGGTSLALQLGHRKSENIFIYSIEGIKVDIVNYTYPWIEAVMEEDGIRLAHMEDIAAMKLSAVTGRGTKRDFIDISFLLHQFSIKQMLGFYNQKYYDGSEFLVIKSLTYFDDADHEQDPVMLQKMIWEDTKRFIIQKLEDCI